MQLLLGFACLTMCSSILLALLGEQSSMRRTALLASGLLLAAMWLDGMEAMLQTKWSAGSPDGWLERAASSSVAKRQQDWLKEAGYEQDTGVAAP